jgi:hypothetical protein
LIAVQNVAQNMSLESSAATNEEDGSQSASDDEVDVLIKAREKQSMNGKGLDSKSICNSNLLLEFDKYEQQGRQDKKINILEFWRNQRFAFPLLYEASLIVLAVPTTQVSVERAFSGVKFLLSPQRCQLNSELLDDIVLIRCNSIFDL